MLLMVVFVLQIDCLVCSYCFRFIGSIELQIGRKLYWRDLGVSTDECERKEFLHIQRDCYNSDPSDEEDYSDAEDRKDIGGYSSSSSKSKISIPKDVIESLMNGDLRLPYSEEFPLPSTVSCPGGCKEAYYCR